MYQGVLVVPPTTATYNFLLNWYLVFGTAAAVIVIALLVFFMVRYRDRGETTPMPAHRVEGWKLVAVTVLISLTVLTAAEYQTFASFGNIEVPSSSTCLAKTSHPCVQVCVEAFQWGWNYTYPKDGQTCSQSYYSGFYSGSPGNLTVPAGWYVVFNITSRDVFHSMGISMLAVKEDAIPGRVNQLWLSAPTVNVPTTPDVAGVQCNAAGTACTYVDAVRCFELCGVGHALMWANLTVVSQATWTAWTGGQIG